jgi:hypothetical protein
VALKLLLLKKYHLFKIHWHHGMELGDAQIFSYDKQLKMDVKRFVASQVGSVLVKVGPFGVGCLRWSSGIQ